jgi:hypothetical protein
MKNNNLKAIILLFIFVTLSMSCSKKTQENTNTDDDLATTNRIDQQGAEDFELFYHQFISDFNLKNTRYLNRYIDEEDGFLIIASEGIYSLPHQFKSFAKFMQFRGEEQISYIQKAKFDTKLEYGAKPIFDCETKTWNRQGCYWNDKPNPQFSVLYDVLMEHHIIPHDQNVEEEIKSVDILATRIVYDTNNQMGFYFNRMNNKWILLCIERILPCGAASDGEK